ncbi:hypothetical protein [Enterococcus cecorum]|uniref:hypothetical protein n=1 Tax=Enterococcus cecorum TaxID=44008 RepID=UPI001FAB6793|nr:hypothetical protein [Enterococcus cecorum]MCJ0536951.1 hypothetical protein [Enterococcus cecorum]MCJ0546262.1 hypothetical protein [Enterococcus cecorum]MCJ0551003.1 hypothetical protein [Enterococcus cecorum]MCJ0569072.1 hypothetical protein [Enterococcus cecorum]
MIMRKIKLGKVFLVFFTILVSCFLCSGFCVNADENESDISELKKSEFIESDVTEAIITEFDVPQYDVRTNKRVKRSYAINPETGGACWRYQYSGGPFDIYKRGGQYKLVKNTGFVTYVTGTI